MERLSKPVDPINLTVGGRLRLKRGLLGMSQTDLGKAVGVSRIKIGQFEAGHSAIPASTLYKLSRVLKIDLKYFFEDDLQENQENTDLKDLGPLLNREAISLLKDFGAINNMDVRKKLAAVMERASELMMDKEKS